MVHIVLHEVVLREVGNVGMLDVRNVRCGHKTNIHNGGVVGEKGGREVWYEVRGVDGRAGRDEAVDWRFDREGLLRRINIMPISRLWGSASPLEMLWNEFALHSTIAFWYFQNYWANLRLPNSWAPAKCACRGI